MENGNYFVELNFNYKDNHRRFKIKYNNTTKSWVSLDEYTYTYFASQTTISNDYLPKSHATQVGSSGGLGHFKLGAIVTPNETVGSTVAPSYHTHSAYAQTNHAIGTSRYGVGTSDLYGHLKISNKNYISHTMVAEDIETASRNWHIHPSRWNDSLNTIQDNGMVGPGLEAIVPAGSSSIASTVMPLESLKIHGETNIYVMLKNASNYVSFDFGTNYSDHFFKKIRLYAINRSGASAHLYLDFQPIITQCSNGGVAVGHSLNGAGTPFYNKSGTQTGLNRYCSRITIDTNGGMKTIDIILFGGCDSETPTCPKLAFINVNSY